MHESYKASLSAKLTSNDTKLAKISLISALSSAFFHSGAKHRRLQRSYDPSSQLCWKYDAIQNYAKKES
jgi:hypothetical protein